LKEITAIIRRDKLPETKTVLRNSSDIHLSRYKVSREGGKQRGAMCAEMDSEMPDSFCTASQVEADAVELCA